jgi:predicted GH43/DUF377 family glycosyl hydrolase
MQFLDRNGKAMLSAYSRLSKLFLLLLLVLVALIFSSDAPCQTQWQHHPNSPVLKLSSDWDSNWLEPKSIVQTDSLFHMWYFGANKQWKGGLGYATSTDGIQWQRYDKNPILTKGEPGAWNEAGIGGGSVILMDSIFYGWFWGWNADRSSNGLGLATSTDGINWTEYENNPVISSAATGDWDDFATLQYLDILFNGDQFMMYYCGCKNEYKSPGRYTMKIGCATSPDGVTWTPYENNPVLVESETSSAWDYWRVEWPTVVKNHAGYHMWFHGDNALSQIGYAHSDDGFNWTKYEKNPVLSPRTIGSWGQIGIVGPKVLYDASDNSYKMWYMGGTISNGAQTSQIGYATAPNDSVETVVQRRATPEQFTLLRNYPNPFNPTTTIEYDCSTASDVTLDIYDLSGRRVKRLVHQKQNAGRYRVTWQADDERGRSVPAGLYFARLHTGEFQHSIKLTLIK